MIKQESKLRLSNLFSFRNNKDLFLDKNCSFFHMARYGLYEIAKRLNDVGSINVLVPSYHCDAIVKPFEKAGVKVKFYKIDKNCNTDFVDLAKKIDMDTKAVVMIHYFGFPNEIEKYVSICKKKNVLLIEDCVQSMFSSYKGKRVGLFGDVSFVSWRKFLPLEEGASFRHNGFLMNNQSRLDIKNWLKAVKNTVENVFSKDVSIKPLSSGKVDIDRSASELVPAFFNKKPTGLTERIFRKYDIRSVVIKRRNNYAYLMEALKNSKIVLPFQKLIEGVCPSAFPLIVKEDNVDVKLRAKGISACQWRYLSPDLSRKEFKDAYFLMEHLVFLPVHEGLNMHELNHIIEEVKKLVR